MSIKVEFLCEMEDGRKQFRLLAPFIQKTPFGTRRVPKGFISDGTSSPRWAWWIIAPWDYLEASIPHDYDYSVATPGMTRMLADATYRWELARQGCPLWRRWLVWLALRVGGWRAYRPRVVKRGRKPK